MRQKSMSTTSKAMALEDLKGDYAKSSYDYMKSSYGSAK